MILSPSLKREKANSSNNKEEKAKQSKARQGKARQENSSKTQNKEMGIYKNKTMTQPKQKNNTKSKRKVLVPPHLHLLLLLLPLPLLLHIAPINARLVACAHTWAGGRGAVGAFLSFLPAPPSFFLWLYIYALYYEN
jgi:hypothetical protein